MLRHWQEGQQHWPCSPRRAVTAIAEKTMFRNMLIGGIILFLSCASAWAQYPDRPVHLVVPFPPGGPTDVFARLLAAGLAPQLGQQVVIENKSGAGGNIGTEMVAKAKPDGYTLLFGTAATHGINVSLYKNLPYDPIKDFELIAIVGVAPTVLLVPPDQPRTVAALVAKMKAEPGKWSYASAGNGTTNHLGGELFKMRTGIDVVHVPYRGSGPALQDLLAGHIAYMFGSFGTSLEYINAGTLFPLAVTAAQRSAVAPQVPAMAEAGVPGVEAATWNVVAAPAGTPKEIVDQLGTVINKVLKDPAMAARLKQLGMEPVDAPTPAATKAFVKSEIKKWREVVIAAGARID
jgi:tripartite-type tricarboxylate transporter receptor subunit TctC